MPKRIQIRRDISTNWQNNNPVLAQGEIGLETDTNYIKIGNGVDVWNDLPYLHESIINDRNFYLTTENKIELREQWDDIVTNASFFNLPTKTFISSTTTTNVPTFTDNDNKVWFKITLEPNQTKTIKLYNTDTNGNPDEIFEFYDDFDGSNLDTTKWIIGNTTYTVSNGYIELWGNANNILTHRTIKTFTPPFIVDAKVTHTSSSGDHDFLIILGDTMSQDMAAIIDLGASNAGYYDGQFRAVFSSGSLTNPYNVTLKNTGSNLYLHVTDYIPEWLQLTYSSGSVPIGIACDEDNSGNRAKLDWIRVRKYYDDSDITITQVGSVNDYVEYEITNNTNNLINDVQICIDKPSGFNYCSAIVETSIPEIIVPIFPKNEITGINFTIQVPHSAKLGSNLRFHIHSLIHNDINLSNGNKVKFRLSVISANTNEISNLITNERVFTIEETDKNKIKILNFGNIISVSEISQILICKLTRLPFDSDDTLDDDLPVSYFDFHFIKDTRGSNSEFSK